MPSVFDSYRNSMGIVETRSTMPDRVYLSDGGHIENLGLYPLLVKGKENIVVVDMYTDPDQLHACLMFALNHARATLGCSFYALKHENPGWLADPSDSEVSPHITPAFLLPFW